MCGTVTILRVNSFVVNQMIPSLPNPGGIYKEAMAGILTYGQGSERLPKNISDVMFTRETTYSSGTVRDLHPIPF